MYTLESATNPQVQTTSWDGLQNEKPTYLHQVLLQNSHSATENVSGYFGTDQHLSGLDLSTTDVSSSRMKNQGFKELSFKLAEFKNHMFVDERTRRMINDALKTATTPEAAQMVTNTQQQNANKLMQNALVSREIMFAQALTTGSISLKNNNISAKAEFPMDPAQFITVKTPWGNKDSSSTDDINAAIDTMSDLNNTTISHAIMNKKTFNLLFKSGQITNTLGLNSVSNNVAASSDQINRIFSDATGIDINIYDKGIAGSKFIPDGKVILIPDGMLGRMMWTDTNEALTAMDYANQGVQSSTTNEGITLTVSSQSDPGGVKYLVSEDCLPLIEASQSIAVMDVLGNITPAGNDGTQNDGSNGSTSASGSNSGKDSGK